jgi:type II secretory pathway pseudopilin PulG
MYNNFFKRGISLIVLIITIVVIVILACAIILSVSKNNPVTNANKAVVQSDFKTLESELNMYISDELVSSMGDFDSLLLFADTSSVTYNGVKDTTKSITDILTTLKGTKYVDYVTIAYGKIIVGDSAPTQTKEWAEAVITPLTTCELKDAPTAIKNTYKFSEAKFSKYSSTSVTISSVTIFNKDYSASDFMNNSDENLKNVIVYYSGNIDGCSVNSGYYKFISTSLNVQGNFYITDTSSWQYLGSSYKVTY